MHKDEVMEKLRQENAALSARLSDAMKKLKEADYANVRLLNQQKKLSSIFRFIDIFQEKIRETTDLEGLYRQVTLTFYESLGLDLSSLFYIDKKTCRIETLSLTGSTENLKICDKIPGVSVEDLAKPKYFNEDTGSQPLREYFLEHCKIPDFVWYPIEETDDKLMVLMGGKRFESRAASPPFSDMALEAMGAISSAIIVRRDSIIKTCNIIKENEEKILLLAEIMKTSSFSVIASDENGNITYINPATERLYGYGKNELIGKSLSVLSALDETEFEKLKRNIVLTLIKGKTWKGETVNKRKNGEIFYIRLAMYLLRDENDKFKAAIGFHEDITEHKKLKEEMLSLSQFRESVIENANAWIMVIDNKRDIVVWNKAAEKISGYSREEVIGNPDAWKLLFPIGTLRNALLETLTNAIKSFRQIEDYETIILCKDGKCRIISWNSRTMVNRDNEPSAAIIIGRDITEYKKAVTSLQESEERLRTIFETAIDSIFIKNKKLCYTHVNPSVEMLLNIPTDDIIGKNDYQIFGAEMGEHIDEIDRRVLKGEVIEEELTLPLIGRNKTLHFIKVPMRDSNGDIVGLCGIARDITDRKTMEEELRKSREFYHNILNAVDDPIFVKDSKHRWVIMNDRLCELMGHSREELVGKSDFDFYPEDQAEVFWKMDDLLFKTGKTNVNEEEITWKGKVHSISTKKSLFTDPNTGEKLLAGAIRDITDRKRMEKELIAKNRELNDFAYRVSHDLKNPINMIKGFIQEINETPELFNDYFNKISNLSDHLIQQINSLLKLSRAGRIIAGKTLVDFEVLIKGIFIPLRPDNVCSDLILNTEVEEIRGDPGGIEEVFNNLIQNSINYRDKTKEKLVIEVSCKNNGGKNHIIFKDNGRGIDEIFLDKVFSPGFTLKSEKGTGFGLAIVKKIIEAHGGTIGVFSEGENKGAEFIISLPE